MSRSNFILCVLSWFLISSNANAQSLPYAKTVLNDASKVQESRGQVENTVRIQAPITISGRPVNVHATDINYLPLETGEKPVKFLSNLLGILPGCFWLNIAAENSLRYESNVLLTENNLQRNAVLRSQPEVFLGLKCADNTHIYADYSLVKDIFFVEAQQSIPTPQFLSLGIRKRWNRNRNSFVFDSYARENWSSSHVRSADLIPNITYIRRFKDSKLKQVYFNALLQLHSRNLFQGATQEIDPAYTAGASIQLAKGFTLQQAVVLNTNYRHHPFRSNQNSGNMSISSITELDHPIKGGLTAFLRAENLWNAYGHNQDGVSGYDFRLSSGFRFTLDRRASDSIFDLMARPKS